MGEIPLMTEQRLVRDQRHRARDRLAAASLAGRVLRARPRQDALVGQAPVLGAGDSRIAARGSTSSSIRRTTSISASTAAARCPSRRCSRRSGCPTRTSSSTSSPSTPSIWARRARRLDLVPERLRGEVARFDLVGKDGKVLVQKDKRITARHIRELAEGGVKKIAVPNDYIVGRTLAHNIVNKDTGEIIASANDEITDELLTTLLDAGVSTIQTIYVNDLDQGAVHRAYAEDGRHARPDGRAHRHLSHDASRRAADRGRGRGAVPRPVLQRGALRPVAGRTHEVQPSRRPQRADRPGHADQRRHHRGHQDPGRAAQWTRRDRRHRSPRQPPRALGRRARGKPVPLGSGARRARGQGAPRPGREREPASARPDQRQADLGGDQGVLRKLAAFAVHGPDQPAVGNHAQAPRLRARSGRSHARARRLRSARRASDALWTRLPDRDAGRPEHRPDQLAGAVRAHQRVRFPRDAVSQGGQRQGDRRDPLSVRHRGRRVRDRAGQCDSSTRPASSRTSWCPAAARTSSCCRRPTRSSSWTWRRRRSCRWRRR